MNSETQPRQQGDTYMSIVLALIGAIIAWPALRVGAGAHQATDSRPVSLLDSSRRAWPIGSLGTLHLCPSVLLQESGA